MALDELYELIINVVEQTREIDEVIANPTVEKFKNTTLIEATDQEIDDYVKEKEIALEDQELIISIVRKIKMEQFISNIDSNVEEEDNVKKKKLLNDILSEVADPTYIVVKSDYVTVKFPLNSDSKLMKKIDDIQKWDKENVKETISSYTGVPIENIALIDSVNAYIEFVSEFEENNYVSRGQKDCTYRLVPSLYRLYDDGYVGHASKYESTFKQKVIYYDNTVEKKNTEEIRAYAQHFGLPTNYLDFTEAHLISLLFAVEEYDYIKNHSIVYFVDAKSHNFETIRTDEKLIDFSDQNLRESVKKTIAINHFLFVLETVMKGFIFREVAF